LRATPITVVLTASRARRLYEATLESIENQTLRPLNVVVVKDESAARNAAIARATTPYVFLLNAGDTLLPSCFERLSAALDHSGAAFAYSYLRFGRGSRADLMNLQPWDAQALRARPCIEAMALLRRHVWKQLGGFRPMPRGLEGHDFWLRLAEAGGWGVQVPELLGSCRATQAAPGNERYLRVARALLKQTAANGYDRSGERAPERARTRRARAGPPL
jgi:hypothetical protein